MIKQNPNIWSSIKRQKDKQDKNYGLMRLLEAGRSLKVFLQVQKNHKNLWIVLSNLWYFCHQAFKLNNWYDPKFYYPMPWRKEWLLFILRRWIKGLASTQGHFPCPVKQNWEIPFENCWKSQGKILHGCYGCFKICTYTTCPH